MKKLMLGLLFASFLMGCSSVSTQTLKFVTSATNVKYYYENGGVVDFVGSVDLSDASIAIIIDALDTIDEAKKKFKELENNPSTIVTHFEVVTYEYSKVKSAYNDIRIIVIDHFDEYTPIQQAAFIEFDISARTLDEQFVSLVDAVEKNAALMTALRFTDTIIKITSTL